ncbi:MAG: tRNA (adenosine(37)-N6)-threonylcarbamoyltransferase complex dimerization subunit type 1 TsaB [Chloroflexi bacterium]|nr:tRNA (adenosine(37)-N6)-threonylcarbamoyltransferase complex dimerization subunit type 1 TsaB [Chloroflexota bacterium]
MELSIDTSTRYASVALSREGDALAELTWRSERNHSVELTPAIREAISRAGAEMGQVEAVFIAKGPGSFSALRVGMSTAKALASALVVPLVAIATLDIEAQPYLRLGHPVRALIGAGKNRLYVGKYGEAAPEYDVLSPEALIAATEEPTIFCGEAVAAISGTLRVVLGKKALVAGAAPPTRRAGVLAQIAYKKLLAGATDDPVALEPLYMRSGQVEMAERTWATG